MIGGWRTKQLGNLCDVLDHKRQPITKRDRVAGAYPYYGATGVLGYVEGYLFDEKLVLVGEDGAKWGSGENTSFAVEGKIWVNNHAHVLRPQRDKIIDNWLIYFLNHSDLSEFVSGLTVPKLNQGNLREIPIPLPPLPEQKRIVGILDEAFAGIATAKANAEKNLQNARAIFESHLQAVFTQRGEHWEQYPLVKLCVHFFDSAHRTPKYQEQGIPALRPRDVVNGRLDLTGAARVSQEEYEIQSKRYKPNPGDLVYSRELSYGWAARLPESPKVCLSQGMCIFRPTTAVDSNLLLYILNGPIGREQAERTAVGAAHPHINLGDIKSYIVPLPPLDEQRQIAQRLDSIAVEVQRLESLCRRKLVVLEELKKSLLHQAFTGEL
jgi:type I restriction enzyme, S subunit